MDWNLDNGTIRVRDVVDRVQRLGVPHFQRGRVWGPDAIASLLESLFHETPCGSFVFWKSSDNARFGVPLDESKSLALDYLIIDGQQRIRSLYCAFTDAPLEDDEATEDAGPVDIKGPKQWCVNLTKAPKFDGLLRERARNFQLFVYATNPRKAPPRSPLRENILPLREVLEARTWDELSAYHGLLAFREGISDREGLASASKLYPEFRQRILAIQDGTFFITVLDGSDLAQMAALYNRINTGGKQVETEERAFATLVGLQPGNTSISDGLRGIFRQVHPDGRERNSRNALLKRQEERAFGFKLFIRVFLQVCQHHLGFRQGKSSFSFDLVGREDFCAAFKTLSKDDVNWLWNEASRVVAHVRTVLLEQELKCDDLRMLPDATGLMPVLQLLIQYPDLEREAYRPLLAGLCLRLALADMSSRDLLRWVAEAGDPTKLAFEVIPGLWKAVQSEVTTKLGTALDEANSIRDRYVLLLYWLERYLGANDFRYDKVKSKKTKLKPPELNLSRTAKPEKQHLVPSAYSSQVFGVELRPTEWHTFNNVGNLTYISAQLNGLDALSDDFADLMAERERAQNLRAHLFLGDGQDEALGRYEWIRSHLEDSDGSDPGARVPSDRQSVEQKFLEFTRARRQVIHTAILEWLADLDLRAKNALNVEALDGVGHLATTVLRIAPLPPRFPIETHPAHFLRKLRLGNDAEYRLLVVLREAKPQLVDASTLRLQITRRRKDVWIDVSSDGVTFGVKSRFSGPLRAGVFDALGLPDSGSSEIPLDPVPDCRNLLDYCAANENEIAKASQKSKKSPRPGAKHPTPAVRDLGYARPVEQRLIGLGGDDKGKARDGAEVSLRFRQSTTGRAGKQVLRVDLHDGGKTIDLRLRPDLGERIKMRFPRVILRKAKHKSMCTLSGEQTMVAALDWLASELKRLHADGGRTPRL